MKENKKERKTDSPGNKKVKEPKQDTVTIRPEKIIDPAVNRYAPDGIKLK